MTFILNAEGEGGGGAAADRGEDEKGDVRGGAVVSRSACGGLVTEGRVSILSSRASPSPTASEDVVVVDDAGGESEAERAEAAAAVVVVRKGHRVSAGDTLIVTYASGGSSSSSSSSSTEIIPQNLPLDILYEDEDMIVLNKAAGMVVHPAAGNWDGTVVNALAYYLSEISPYGTGEFVKGEDEEGGERVIVVVVLIRDQGGGYVRRRRDRPPPSGHSPSSR